MVNPFTPGSGSYPEVFAGRDPEVARLEKMLDELDVRPPARDVVFVGPRGNGKTALLRHLKRMTEGRCRQVLLVGKELTTPSDVVERLAKALGEESWLDRLGVVGAKVGIGGLSVEIRRAIDASAGSVGDALSSAAREAGRPPLVLCVDEAHEMAPAVMGLLLNASQTVRTDQGHQLMLVLAGTPRLATTIRGAGATFWDRCAKFRIGLLSRAASRRILVETMACARRTFEHAALETALDATQDYSYFVQLLGGYLYEASEETRSSRIRDIEVTAALAQFALDRDEYYGERFSEIASLELRKPAVVLARALQSGRRTQHRYELEEALRQGGVSGDQVGRTLAAVEDTGFVWREQADDYALGIPSLGAFAVRHSPDVVQELNGTKTGAGLC